MNRRQFLAVAASAAPVGVAGCAGVSDSGSTQQDGSGGSGGCAGAASTDGPQSPFDYLALHPVPAYVTEYADSVVVRFRDLDDAAKRAVRRALENDGEYRECAAGEETTDVMALFSHVERRWETTGESYDHTYLRHDDDYYALNIVQEGDFIRVKSIPCTDEACPGTPTPPS